MSSVPPAFRHGCHANTSPYVPPPPPRRVVVALVQWTRPAPGWHKLNFDGSVHHDGSGRASIGGVIRDSYGRTVLAFGERTPHAGVGEVEARALIHGLHLALQNGCDRLVVEGDDLLWCSCFATSRHTHGSPGPCTTRSSSCSATSET
jgi:hypothetical protein